MAVSDCRPACLAGRRGRALSSRFASPGGGLCSPSAGSYLWVPHRPHAVTTGQFETTSAARLAVAVRARHRPRATAATSSGRSSASPETGAARGIRSVGAFIVFAFCNPWTEGPGILRWSLVSPERFTALYSDYFHAERSGHRTPAEPRRSRCRSGYARLSALWRVARPLGRCSSRSDSSRSARSCCTYATRHGPHAAENGIWTNTLVQLTAILAIAAPFERDPPLSPVAGRC